MKNRDLIQLLQQLDPDAETGIEHVSTHVNGAGYRVLEMNRYRPNFG